uniref:uncharacterized protein lrrc41 n=1 Tax=Centroberyx gerrardi TaxID=166262 RepID=UPI003AB02670
MHEAYAEEVLRLAAKAAASRCLTSLKKMCLQAASQHFAALDMKALLELPTSLIKDLLPHLNISHLDKFQPALNLKGISTYSAWVAILQDIRGPHRVIDIHTEEESKQEAMDTFFQLIFYGFKYICIAKHISNVNIKSLLLVMAKCVKHFYLRPSQFLRCFTTEQRPLLNILEKSVICVDVKYHIDFLKMESHYALYVLHRMLDHGEAKELIIYDQDPMVLAWILHARGSQYANHQSQVKSMHGKRASCFSNSATATAGEASSSPDTETEAPDNDGDHVTPCKRSKLDFVSGEEESGMAKSPVDPQVLCQTFSPSAGHSPEACPQGQIHSLQIRECGPKILTVLIPFLPTWLCLRSLTLQSCSIFSDLEVLTLARSLKQLSGTSGSSLADLSVGVLPHAALTETLLDASLNLRSLSVEIHPVAESLGLHGTTTVESTGLSELPLEKLSVKVPQVETDLHSITSVLKRCPSLTSLQVSGIRLSAGSSHRQLLTSVSDSNQRLRRLNLEDINLADCLPEILNLLRNCMLEELSFRDCRLLERCSNKEESLQQLVDSLKRVPTLHSLSLAQNRLAKSVPVLAELFTGSSPSTVKKLDISSNFIQPAELLEFGRQMEKHRPPHRVTLDLRKNPWDRDHKVWYTALRSLHPVCDFLVDGWKSRDTMADHISNM